MKSTIFAALLIIASSACAQTVTTDNWRFNANLATVNPFNSPSTVSFNSTSFGFIVENSIGAGNPGTYVQDLDTVRAFWDVSASSGTSISKEVEYYWGAEANIGDILYAEAGAPGSGNGYSETFALRGTMRLTSPLLGSSNKVGRLSILTKSLHMEATTSGAAVDQWSHTGLTLYADSTTLNPIQGDIEIVGSPFDDITCRYVMLLQPRTNGGLRAAGEIASLLGDASDIKGYTGLEEGTYNLELRARSCTRWTGSVEVTSSGIELDDDVCKLYLGDLNDDNTINTDDYLLLDGFFDADQSDNTWNSANAQGVMPSDADLDCDGHIGTNDYLILSDNFDVSGS